MALGASLEQGLVFVAGTRPEAVKLAPIILSLKARGERPVLVGTGQHGALLQDALAAFDLTLDHDLAPLPDTRSPSDLVGQLLPRLAAAFRMIRPRAVIVQGDTTSALSGAQAAAYARVPVVHVEAGLRTGHEEPFPEELHRKLIAQIATVHLAPTAAAHAALLREGINPAMIEVTGNSGIDALHLMLARIDADPALAASLALRFARIDPTRPLIVATVHRRENHGDRLAQVIAALAYLAADAEIVVPVHPHPEVTRPVRAALTGRHGLHLLPPLDYPAFVWLLRRATLVLTDSGGVQEEAPALGVPALVLRDVTERREGVDTGNARLVGTRRQAIVTAARELLDQPLVLGRMSEPALPYGDGSAAARIAEILLHTFGAAAQPIAVG